MRRPLLLALLLALLAPAASAQEMPLHPETFRTKSPGQAFALSLLLPGFGQRYANDTWAGAASAHAIADVGLWLAVLGVNWQEGQAIQSYETLASVAAGNDVSGRERRFFITMGRYMSSEDYLEALLRERRWDELESARNPNNQWRWNSEAELARYRGLRERAESLGRQVPVYGSLLVANRLLAGISAIRAARAHNRGGLETALSLGVPPHEGASPTVRLSVQF
jgi:hypothetical protein